MKSGEGPVGHVVEHPGPPGCQMSLSEPRLWTITRRGAMLTKLFGSSLRGVTISLGLTVSQTADG